MCSRACASTKSEGNIKQKLMKRLACLNTDKHFKKKLLLIVSRALARLHAPLRPSVHAQQAVFKSLDLQLHALGRTCI
jgi:hypothetical protein